MWNYLKCRAARSWASLLVFNFLATPLAYSLEGDNVCYRYESYTETETIPRNQTVQVLTRQWCLDIPPRCTSYRTELKEVFVKQNVTRTRRVEFCCEGYQEQRFSSGNDTSPPTTTTTAECRPICRGGCIHGECRAPNTCSCEAGFSGRHCLHRCRNGTWGVNCRNRCHCQNYSHCDTKTGHCRCTEGWMGKHCETPCPEGFYGTMCVSKCNCTGSSRLCHPQTGHCLPVDEIVMFDNITRTVESSYSSESTERISAEQWIKVANDTLPVVVEGSSSTSSTTSESPTTSSTASSSLTSETPETTSDPTVNTTSTTTSMSTTTTEASGQMLSNATYAESYHEYLPNNTEMSMVLTKGHSHTASNESVYELVTTTSRVEITFIDTAVKRIDSSPDTNTTHLVEESSSLGDENSTETQLVYLESENQPVLVGISDGTIEPRNREAQAFDDPSQALVTISCLLITFAVLLSVVLYMKRLNRKTMVKPVQAAAPVKIVDESVQTTGSDTNRSSDPLPELPQVTYTRVQPKPLRNGDIEHYDVPANNSFIHRAKKASPYNYNFDVHSKAAPRKYSLEHIYDEIQYPALPEAVASSAHDNNGLAIRSLEELDADANYAKPMEAD